MPGICHCIPVTKGSLWKTATGAMMYIVSPQEKGRVYPQNFPLLVIRFQAASFLKKLFVLIWRGWHLIQDVLKTPKENLRASETKSKLVLREKQRLGWEYYNAIWFWFLGRVSQSSLKDLHSLWNCCYQLSLLTHSVMLFCEAEVDSNQSSGS